MREVKEKVRLSIVMPCLNEARTVGKCIDDAKVFLERRGISGEIIVVDNNSTDKSARIAKKHGARVISEKEPGYGAALRAGFAEARGEYIIMGDCDRTYDFRHMWKMWKLMQTCDMVVGDRFKGRLEQGAISRTHNVGVRVLSWLARKRFRSDVYDFHCGIRGMRREAIAKLDFRTTGMEFATEMIALAARAGLSIKQLPVNYRKSVKGRRPKLNTVRDGLRHLDYIFFGMARPFWRLLCKYSATLLGGVLLGVLLLVGVAKIPKDAIYQHSVESAEYFQSYQDRSMKPDLIPNFWGSKMDFYADSILLSIAYDYDSEDSVRSIARSNYYWEEDASQGANYEKQLKEGLSANREYIRYWHGSIVWVRPLLVFFNVKQIYVINGIVIIALMLMTIAALCRHREFFAAFAFLVAMVMGWAFLAPISLEYSWVFMVMGLANLLVLRAVWKGRQGKLAWLFFAIGMLVNYVDFLTSETVVLTIPLLLALWLRRKERFERKDFWRIVGAVASWLAGYTLMWVAKWVFASVVLRVNALEFVGEHVGERSYSDMVGGSVLESLKLALQLNFGQLMPFCWGVWGVLSMAVVLLVMAYLMYVYRKNRTEIYGWRIWAFVLVAILPLLRFGVLLEHEMLHFFFTYRALTAVVLGVLLIFCYVVDWRGFRASHSRKKK